MSSLSSAVGGGEADTGSDVLSVMETVSADDGFSSLAVGWGTGAFSFSSVASGGTVSEGTASWTSDSAGTAWMTGSTEVSMGAGAGCSTA